MEKIEGEIQQLKREHQAAMVAGDWKRMSEITQKILDKQSELLRIQREQIYKIFERLW